MAEKKYTLDIKQEILNILGPNMYSNIYYILGEMIANSYDADSTKVWLTINLKENNIEIEDNGIGMTLDEINNKYLKIGQTSRTDSENELTKIWRRKKMGRKGIGKLSALAASTVITVLTKKENVLNGFKLAARPLFGENNEYIQDIDDIETSALGETFIEKNNKNGTKTILNDVKIKIPKAAKTIRKNLEKIFPIFSEDFELIIKVVKENGIEEELINGYDYSSLFDDLANVNTYGEEFNKYIVNPNSDEEIKLKEKKDAIVKTITLRNKLGEKVEKELKISGWIGTVKTTKNRNNGMRTDDFNDNYISIFSNGKLGMFNIIPKITKNKLEEVYLIGNVYVDLFEDTELEDMALANREGYAESDERWDEFVKLIFPEINDVLKKRKEYTNKTKKNSRDKKLEQNELRLSKKIELFNKTIKKFDLSEKNEKDLEKSAKGIMEVKSKSDEYRKKIFISHSSKDVFFGNLLESFLTLNGIDSEEIIYTSSENYESRFTTNGSIYEYLRKFFVESWNKSELIVFYIFSNEMCESWNATTEVGAGWITKANSKVFVINKLNKSNEYIKINKKEESIIELAEYLSKPELPLNEENNLFCSLNQYLVDDESKKWIIRIKKNTLDDFFRIVEDTIKNIIPMYDEDKKNEIRALWKKQNEECLDIID